MAHKYLKEVIKRLKRNCLRALIAPMVQWSPLRQYSPGYTIVVACHWRFPEMFEASLQFLGGQDLTNCHELICAFDSECTPALECASERIKARCPAIRIRFLFQSHWQSVMLRMINWGWVDCWLSYAKCLATLTTKYAMLHDMDAMLIDKNFIERRFALVVSKNLEFLGIRWYAYNGLDQSDELLYVVEMLLDVKWLREKCHPIDLFNKIVVIGKRRVDLDTLIYPQTLSSKKMVLPIDRDQWVHPSQVISQFTYLVGKKGYIPPAENNLFFIPYFMSLVEGVEHIVGQTKTLTNSTDPLSIKFLGQNMNISKLTQTHFKWIEEQINTLEMISFSRIRPEVVDYLSSIKRNILHGQ